jgi:hypothetical protein
MRSNRATRAQLESLRALYQREPLPESFLSFRRRCHWEFGRDPALLVQWCGMWCGIEPDGYCHT